MEEITRLERLRMALANVVGDCGAKADQVVAEAKQRYADNSEWDWLAPTPDWEYSEEACICDNLEKAILDEYFGRISREAAIAIRDTLKSDGRICIDKGCPEYTLDSRRFAIGWNERHKDNPIDIHYTGYVPFEI